jgi:hypothetical protein
MNKEAAKYRHKTDLIYAVFWIVAVPAIPVVIILSSTLFEGGWGIAFSIFVGLIALSTAMSTFEALRTKRTNGEYAIRFPGYAGSRFAIFNVLRYEDSDGAIDLQEPECVFSFGEASDRLFLLKNNRPEDVTKMPPGKIVQHPVTFRPIVLHLAEIVDVSVIERSDAEIAESAIDRRDYAEKIGSVIAQRMTGTRIKTTIMPYAAFIAITARNANGEAFLLAAVPTNVTAGAMNAMGDLAATDDAETPWLVAEGINKAKSAAIDEIETRATELLGKPAADVVHQGVDLVEEVSGYVDEAKTLLDPDAASIATTAGGRGRHLAQLIASRIRMRAFGRSLGDPL